MARPDDVELATGFTVKRYRALEANHEQAQIATLISRRFTERYLGPTLSRRNVKHGFTTMAVGCLMLEALESFRLGLPNTKSASKTVFCSFFDHHDEFAVFRGHAERFWLDVRCGILHQAETRGGWTIRRSGPLFDSSKRVVNATRFVRTLGRVLKQYCRGLKTAEWNSETWRLCRKKMDAIVATCS